ncbi:MAG: hypothetical protein CMJ46_01665 [Planctomyces sp.]|nr:hypothetical protein [Planctomyces sp.]
MVRGGAEKAKIRSVVGDNLPNINLEWLFYFVDFTDFAQKNLANPFISTAKGRRSLFLINTRKMDTASYLSCRAKRFF